MANSGFNSLFGSLLGSVGNSQDSMPDYYRQLQGQQGYQPGQVIPFVGEGLGALLANIGQFPQRVFNYSERLAESTRRFKERLTEDIMWMID